MEKIELHGFNRIQFAIGGIINYYGLLEKVMDRIIGYHYIGTDDEKVSLFKEDVLQSKFFGFEFKRSILKKILDKNYPENKNQNTKILKQLTKLQEVRNTLAHGAIFASKGDEYFEDHNEALVDWQGKEKKIMPLLREFDLLRRELAEELAKIPGANIKIIWPSGIKFVDDKNT